MKWEKRGYFFPRYDRIQKYTVETIENDQYIYTLKAYHNCKH